MVEKQEWERKQEREKLADEAICVMLDGLKAFFSGKATLHIDTKQTDGMPIRFVKDARDD